MLTMWLPAESHYDGEKCVYFVLFIQAVFLLFAKHFQCNWCNLKWMYKWRRLLQSRLKQSIRRPHLNPWHKWQIWTCFFLVCSMPKMEWKSISNGKNGKIPKTLYFSPCFFFSLCIFANAKIRYEWNWRMLIYAIIIERYGNLVMHVTTLAKCLEIRGIAAWHNFGCRKRQKICWTAAVSCNQTRNDNTSHS